MTKFTCPVVAKEMTKDVTAKIILGDGTEGAVYAYSVRDYADYVIANSAGNYSDEAITLVKAMLNYGAYSQKYFGYNTEDLANDGVESDLLNIALYKDYSKAINNADGLPEGMDYYGTSLVLESGTVIRHYFTYSGVMGSEQLFAQYGLIQKAIITTNKLIQSSLEIMVLQKQLKCGTGKSNTACSLTVKVL